MPDNLVLTINYNGEDKTFYIPVTPQAALNAAVEEAEDWFYQHVVREEKGWEPYVNGKWLTPALSRYFFGGEVTFAQPRYKPPPKADYIHMPGEVRSWARRDGLLTVMLGLGVIGATFWTLYRRRQP